jgi:hypothetical protein
MHEFDIEESEHSKPHSTSTNQSHVSKSESEAMSEPKTKTERSLTPYLFENPLININTSAVEDEPVFLNDITFPSSNISLKPFTDSSLPQWAPLNHPLCHSFLLHHPLLTN